MISRRFVKPLALFAVTALTIESINSCSMPIYAAEAAESFSIPVTFSTGTQVDAINDEEETKANNPSEYDKVEILESDSDENTSRNDGDKGTKETGEDALEDEIEWEDVHIKSAEELSEFARKCRLDTFSSNKNVYLDENITMVDLDFTGIPYFNGHFFGQGNTISNIRIDVDRSYLGFFNKLDKDAIVSDLNIEGRINPSGEQAIIGGIVGDNKGIISGCSFKGTVNGEDYVGGVAGINELSGIIIDSKTSGNISGTHFTGGIAGENMGNILSSVNEALVNTKNKETSVSVENISVETILSAVGIGDTDKDEAEASAMINGVVDMGGIAGMSIGVIQHCTNKAPVGYKNVGYNAGGIAGRQSGYIYSCINEGTILGRKDIGGIVGQAEPYVTVDFANDITEQLSENIEKLHDILEVTLDNADSSSDTIANRLSIIKAFTDNALSDTRYLENESIDWANSVISTANDAMSRVDYIMDEIAKSDGVMDRTNSAAGDAKDAMNKFDEAISHIDIYSYMDDGEKTQYDNAKQSMKDEMEEHSKYVAEWYEQRDPDTEPSEDDAKEARKYADDKYSENHDGRKYADDISGDVTVMTDITLKYSDDMTGDTKDDAKKAVESLRDSMSNIQAAGEQTKSIISNLNGRSDLSLPSFCEDYKFHANSLTNNIQGMSDNFGLLSSEMNGASDKLVSDLKGVNDQFNVIMLLFTDAIDGVLDDDYTDGNYTDNSLEVCRTTTDATVDLCTNEGIVEGSINVSGICGTMAIEYDFDVESDVTGVKDAAMNRTYQTKCVLRDDVNMGSATAKKDNAGGVCGLQEMGTITGCQNYSKISSETASYVGGIAGSSVSAIVNSFAKCALSGKSYVGGIVGDGCRIYDSFAMVSVSDADEWYGAIAGHIDDNADIVNNYFTGDDLAGIDRVSYAGVAEPIEYDDIQEKIADVPSYFNNLYIDFVLDDADNDEQILIERQAYKFGDSVGEEDYPDVPLKEGYYSAWDVTSVDEMSTDMTITASYIRNNTTLAGDIVRSSNRSAILVDGLFKEEDRLDAVMCINETDVLPDSKEYWEINIPDDGQTTHMVRYMKPDNLEAWPDVYVFNNGNWEMIDSDAMSSMGTYRTFDVDGNNVRLQMVYKASWMQKFKPVLFVLAILAGIAMIIGLILLALKSHKKVHGEVRKRAQEIIEKAENREPAIKFIDEADLVDAEPSDGVEDNAEEKNDEKNDIENNGNIEEG